MAARGAELPQLLLLARCDDIVADADRMDDRRAIDLRSNGVGDHASRQSRELDP